MWTKRSHFLLIVFGGRRWRIPLVVPLYILWDLIDAAEDVFALFGRLFGKKAAHAFTASVQAADAFVSAGRFDLVDVDVSNRDRRVRIWIGLR